MMQRWVVLGGCFIGMAVSVSATLAFPFGLYLAPITSEYGWSRTQFAATLSFISIGNIIMLPMAGYVVDKFGPLRSIAIGLILGSACGAAISMTHSYLGFIIMSCAASMTGSLALYPAYFDVTRSWFDKNLGLALATTSAGVAVGVACFAQIITAAIRAGGWRTAFIATSAVALIIGLINLALLVRKNEGALPQDERLADQAESALSGMTLGAAMRSVDFWLFSMAFFLVVFAGSGPQVHLPALLADHKASPGVVASVVAALAVGSVVGRMITGLLLDRVSYRIVAALFFLGQAVGIAMLSWNVSLAFVAALLLGSALGAEVDIMGFVMARRFGRRAYAQVLGVALAVAQSALLVSPVGAAMIFDKFHSYTLMLRTYPALSIAAVALIGLARIAPNNVAPKP